MARHKEFDVDRALWAAVRVFWRRGYTNTSIQHLVEAMGIERGSLYGTFGGKEKLFKQAVERYTLYQIERMPAGAPPDSALRTWFRNNLDDATGGKLPNGCLVINTAVESPSLSPGVQALVKRHLEQLRRFFMESVASCRKRGLVADSVDPEEKARALLAAIIGINVLSRAGASRAQLEQIATSALGFYRRGAADFFALFLNDHSRKDDLAHDFRAREPARPLLVARVARAAARVRRLRLRGTAAWAEVARA
jgi:TetR/AcrR family transcriptional regulator, transcriptional repressor for nem operon